METNIYPDFPKDKFKVLVTHINEYRVSVWYLRRWWEHWDLGNHNWITKISVFKINATVPEFTVYSKCHKDDTPSRKLGFKVAYDKAVLTAKAIGLI